MATLGIDIGGTNLSLGVVEGGRIVQEIHTPSFRPEMNLGETMDYLADLTSPGEEGKEEA